MKVSRKKDKTANQFLKKRENLQQNKQRTKNSAATASI